MQSDPEEALDVLYRLRENRAKRPGPDAQIILKAIDSLIDPYERRGTRLKTPSV